MEIRPATPEDVPQVLPLVAAICRAHAEWDPDRYEPLPAPEKRYEGWLTRQAASDRGCFFVADHEQKIVGFVVGTVEQEIPIYQLTAYGLIHDLWVEPLYRNEGVGRQLTMHAVERFTELGVKQIRLHTAGCNEVARALFSSCGFRVSSIEMLLQTEPNGEVER